MDKLRSIDMVNDPSHPVRASERRLALSYAPAAARAGLDALLALDDVLSGIVATTREPLVGQMRLTWWYEALLALDAAPAPAHPVLRELQAHVLLRGVTGRMVAAMVDGWEALLDREPLDAGRLDAYAEGRGAQLFAVAATMIGAPGNDALNAAGRGWALADLAGHLSDAGEAAAARAEADRALAQAFETRWSRPLRALGALSLLARADIAGTPPGSPRRVARLLRHRLTGH
jgi:phytoene synthase